MARPGLTKGEVRRARQALIKAGKHPSIDGVRVELGNTGSKGTISRYLKEIEAEEGGAQLPSATISEELQTIVSSLSARLEFEAQERFDGLKAGHIEEVRRLNEQLERAQADARAAQLSSERMQAGLAAEKSARQRADAELADLKLTHGQATAQFAAQVDGLQAQLLAAQGQVASLEEKHTHAREALEHFRTASREQRDREARQHEQQLQYLQREVSMATEALASKQAELRTVLQEKVDALALLTVARAERRQVDEQLRELKPAAERLAVQTQLVEDLRGQVQQAAQQYETLLARTNTLEQRNGEMELQLAAANAAAQSQANLVKDVLERIGQSAAPSKSKAKASTG